MGRPSEEAIKKISDTLKGHVVSEETKAKISAKLKGRMTGPGNPFYGMKHSDESKRKNAAAHKRKDICGVRL